MPKNISPELIIELRQLFDKFDENNDGYVTLRELRQILYAIGHEPTEAEIYDYLDDNESIIDNQIDFHSFLVKLAPKLRDIESDENLRIAFEAFDRSDVGYFTALDVRIVLASMGEVIGEDDSNIIVAEMDPSNTLRVGYKEFLAFMHLAGPGHKI